MAENVFLGYLHPADVSASFHKSLLALVGHEATKSKHLLEYGDAYCAGHGISDGRNKLAAYVMDGPEFEWLFMVDADMGFEPDSLERLMSFADPVHRPMVGGLCFANRQITPDNCSGWRTRPYPVILNWKQYEGGGRFEGEQHFPSNQLIRCGATGGAFILIHRSVLERVAEKFGRSWFDRFPGFDGELMGEDVSFFARTMALEIPLHIHTGIRTTHLKHDWIGEEDFWRSEVPPPATERVAVIVPVLHRPDNIKTFMDSLKASTSLATAYFVCDVKDKIEQKVAKDNGAEVILSDGTFAKKANEGYRRTSELWLLFVGDDVRFHPGWLDHALDVANRYQGDVIATNDLANKHVMAGDHATHPLIRRSYIDEQGASWDGPGIVCHEGYRHNFVDNEISTAARHRQVFRAALGSKVEHLHPIANKAEQDDVYELGQKHYDADAELFMARAAQFVR